MWLSVVHTCNGCVLSDAASLRMSHRRCAREIATQMSRKSLQDTSDGAPEFSSRSRVWKSAPLAAVACSSVATGVVRPHRSEGSMIRALMDLALPKFADSGDHLVQPHRPWIVITDLLASPAPVHSMGLLRSTSPCLNMDALSSDKDNESAGPGDISAAPICVSDDCNTPINTDQVLSDDDLPAAACAGDWSTLFGFVMCPRMYRLWTFHRLVGIHDGQCGV